MALGLVPFAGVGHELLDGAGALPYGTPEARLGLAVGQVVGGIFGVFGGATGEILGGAASATGIGAALGVPAIAVSTVVVVGSTGNVIAGLQGLSEALLSKGSGAERDGGARETIGRNPAQDKKLSNAEIKKLERGGADVHDVKDNRHTGQRDLYKDRDGNIYVKPKGGQDAEGEPTGWNINDF